VLKQWVSGYILGVKRLRIGVETVGIGLYSGGEEVEDWC
jgi:hypothetical protein